jgi:tetratricopeptide (TPR) repeat protein
MISPISPRTSLSLVLFLGVCLFAQTQGVDILLSKARSLEARGRMDLAAQNWKQVLLADPKQSEALAGLARYAKQNGDAEEERSYLERLRKTNPRDPRISEIERMHVITPQERDRLDQAGRLSLAHRPEEAMKIYREVFGDQPPYGKWAEPYYETEASTPGGREKAIAQLRRLTSRDPGNEIYRLWLARMLVFNPKTRMEGLALLPSIHDPGAVEQARTQWRQALLWETENPAVLASVNQYLARYPDPELTGIQRSLADKQEHAAEEASKERGFQALRTQDMATAEARFEDVLRRSPDDINAVAGMAFVRLNQKRFDEAASLFERARTLAPRRQDVQEGYTTAKFWSLIERATGELRQHQPQAAVSDYQAALSFHPQDAQAMLGIAEAEVALKQPQLAEAEFQQVLNQSPNNTDAIAGLAFIRLDEKRFDEALNLFEKARRLVPNRADVDQGYKDAKYWSLVGQGTRAMNENRTPAAMTDFRQALELRPAGREALQGLAGAAERGASYPDAVQAYNKLLAVNPDDAENWLGLIKAQIAANNSLQALATAERVPPALKPRLETRADYLAQLARAYYAAKRPDEGYRTLRRSMDAAAQSDNREALNARLQMAGALLEQGRMDQAIPLYQQATRLHPDSSPAWEGLIGAYARQHDLSQARTAIRSMPQDAYEEASRDHGFLNSMAAIYAADGECDEAEDFLNRSLSLDRSQGRAPAETTELQLADIWVREGNYAKAGQGYRQILARNPNSTSAWRGYLISLHQQHDEKAVLAEFVRMPAGARAELEKDPKFLVLVAGARSTLGDYAGAVRVLEQARALYASQNQPPPADLDLQLAWAMTNEGSRDPIIFFDKVKARADLTPKQRATLDEIWSTWVLRAARAASDKRKPEEAIAILSDAEQVFPNNPKIHGALAGVYVEEHKYDKALNVYASWNLAGATPGDYRSAVGAAIAAHKDDLVDRYLNRGLERFPNDPDLLEMKGKQVIARGNYKVGQSYLQSALRAVRNPAPDERDSSAHTRPGREDNLNRASALATSVAEAPACRRTTSFRMPEDFHIKLVSAVDGEQDAATQNGNNQNTQTQTNPSPADTENADSNIGAAPAAVKSGQIQGEIDVVQNRNTPFGEVGDSASGRTGDTGIDRLIVEEGTLGGSVTGADKARFSVLAHGLYLYSGTPNGQSKSRFGTLPPGATFLKQSTGGVTGELQISTDNFGLDFSATPAGFPVQNLTGGIRFRPVGGPITFLAVRDSVKDSLLSYAGVRDPGTGIVWGGAVSNTGTVKLEHKSERAGQYASVSFSYITGKNILNNWNASGSAGLYFVVAKGLSIGVNGSGMHYDKNLSFFSLGQGGYFSPQGYGLGSIPITWFSRHERFEYEIRASLGAQFISQDRSPIFPKIPVAGQSAFYGGTSQVGPNYSFAMRLGYRLAPHLYFDTFANASNGRNYATQTVGFSLKFMVNPLPTHTDLHVKSVPDWRGNQPFGIQ